MISRRGFLTLSAGVVATAAPRNVTAAAMIEQARATVRLRPGGNDAGYDPWLEVIADDFRNNVKEVSRLAGGRPILAVVKNNAYGIGDTLVGPLLGECKEVAGIACVRPAEAMAMRAAGVRKPILVMAETSEEEAVELVRRDITLSCWLDDARERLERVARRARRPVGVHLYIDAGMGREGMLYQRALPWIEDLARRPSIRILGAYQMFVHEVEFDRVQLQRFQSVTQEAARNGITLGRLHAAPTFELFHLPEAHLDMVRVGQAIFGNYPPGDVQDRAVLKPVFRLRARVVRVERFEPGFAPWFTWDQPRWLGLLPVGHTDGYPSAAARTCQVLINGTLYPVVQEGIFSAHTILDLGPEKRVNVGDTATLVGPDDPAIDPIVVGQNVKLGFYGMITKFSALLPRRMA